MGSYTFRWPHNANEVYVTGTFDDWAKTVKLDWTGDVFEKEIRLPWSTEKVHYKFVVDGIWTTDPSSPEEDDGSNNINNVLYPHQIQPDSTSVSHPDAAIMSGVTPESTTAGLAGKIPRELGDTTISSAAPGSTTAGLASNVPYEQRSAVPGTFPDTPRDGGDAKQFSVNPIPASSGSGNPIHLKPGEKVPDPSTFNPNTVQSTVRTDPAAYYQDASAPLTGGPATIAGASTLPPPSRHMIPESSLPMGAGSLGYEPATIQSAAPDSTTAALAAGVPLESRRQTTTGGGPVREVPDVVRRSMTDAHKDPEAAAYEEAVDEKREVEQELQRKVTREESAGTPAPTVTAATSATAPGKRSGEGLESVSPSSTHPAAGPTVTSGPRTEPTPAVSQPSRQGGSTGAPPTQQTGPSERLSGAQASGAQAQQPMGSQAQQPIGSQAQQPMGSQAQQPIGSQAQQPMGSQAQQSMGSQAQQPMGTQAQQPTSAQAQQQMGSQAQQPTSAQTQQATGTQAQQSTGQANQAGGGTNGTTGKDTVQQGAKEAKKKRGFFSKLKEKFK